MKAITMIASKVDALMTPKSTKQEIQSPSEDEKHVKELDFFQLRIDRIELLLFRASLDDFQTIDAKI